jgi:hypothetical protein
MNVREQSRRDLHRRVKEAIDVETADLLLNEVPAIDWDQLATKDDLAQHRAATKADLKRDLADQRAALRGDLIKAVLVFTSVQAASVIGVVAVVLGLR